jgi:hypothetical protein
MAELKGDAFTVELGHLLDRLMVEILTKHKVSSDDPNMPLSMFLTALSMALYSDVRDRIRVLYQVLKLEKQHQQHESQEQYDDDDDDERSSSNSSPYSGVTIQQIRNMVGYLQDTCQLPPDAQIVPTETKYPTQQWKRGTPEDLVPWDDKNERDLIDLFAFASILRSKSVCAWGECYYKRTFEDEDV